MASRPSNRQRNEWTVRLLALEPDHRVLEIGCDPGLALQACVAEVPAGHILGIDHSEVMVYQARRRLAVEINAGRVEIRLGKLSDMAAERAVSDRIMSSNVVQFLPDLREDFKRIHGCLSNLGMAATTYQPRSKNPSREDAPDMAARTEAAMKAAGFAQIERRELPFNPAPAISLTGRKGRCPTTPSRSQTARHPESIGLCTGAFKDCPVAARNLSLLMHI